jgi:uncharacterized protein YecE (DUF72 family)
MKRYFESYSLVELNSTFYEYPRLETVEGWREKAPENFEFTVKAHQDISHKARMRVDENSQKAFETMKQICKTLKAKNTPISDARLFPPGQARRGRKILRKLWTVKT